MPNKVPITAVYMYLYCVCVIYYKIHTTHNVILKKYLFSVLFGFIVLFNENRWYH